MSNPKDKSPNTTDPKTATSDKDVVTNNDEASKVVNTDNYVANGAGEQDTPSDPESSAPAETDVATEGEISGGSTATDEDVAGGPPVI